MCGEQNGGQNGDRSGEDVAKGKCVGREKWNGKCVLQETQEEF